MSSAPHLAISKEALLNFRYYYFVRQWGKQVMLTIFKYNFLHSTTKTIFDILKDNGVNLGKKSRFNDEEMRKISSGIPLENLDITFLYKICQVLWDKNFNDPGDKLKVLLKKIKDERNHASHEEASLSEKEVLSKINTFGKMLETALDEAYSLYSSVGANFDQLKKDILDVIHKINEKIREKLVSSIPDDVKRFQSELEEFIVHLYEYTSEKCKEELKDLNHNLCRILPFDWLHQNGVTDPNAIMVPLNMEFDKEFHPIIADKSSIIFGQNEILILKTPSSKDAKAVIVTGDAGSGKTTLLSSVVKKWYKNTGDMLNLSSFQTLLYMQFRSHDHDNFDDYLKDHLQRTVCEFNLSLVKASILHSKCLIVCDGYDEANIKSKKLFQNLLRISCRDAKVVVTTRPINSKELSSIINKEKLSRINLHILGVEKENMDGHIRMITNILKSDDTERKETIKDIGDAFKTLSYDIIIILKNPLWLNLFIFLYIESPDKWKKISSVTSLYMKLKEHTMERLTRNLKIKEDMLSEFDKFYREYSLKIYLQSIFELSSENAKDFQTKCKELGLDFDSIMSSYFSIKHTKRSLDIVKVYCYRHRSEQEYDAATAICDVLGKYYDKNVLEKLKEEEKTLFYHALVSEGFIEDKEKYRQDSKRPPYFNMFGSNLLSFMTRILYDASKKGLLYTVIDDIFDMEWQMGYHDITVGHRLDKLISHCVGTRNDQEVVRALIKKINSIYGNTVEEIMCIDPKSLISLPLLLPAIRPKILRIQYNFNDKLLLHMNSTLDAASNAGVLINILVDEGYEIADEHIARAKTCVQLTGKLTKEGIKSLPKCIRELNIEVDTEAINTLSASIHDMKNLSRLSKFAKNNST